jgi:UDP:flavonoid glycosyltransferase YjiC (YdhE family)
MRHAVDFDRVAPRPVVSAPRIVWLAVAEGRGHLMRAVLAKRLLAPSGIDVDIVTTSAAGRAFLDELGVASAIASTGYRLLYDGCQNFAFERTRSEIIRYLVSPRGALRDLAWLERRADGAALVVDDSFHPALLAASLVPGDIGRKLVHLHGENTRRAVLDSAGSGPLAAGIRAALARTPQIEITLGSAADPAPPGTIRLPPLLPSPRPRDAVRAELGVPADRRFAVVYLNPYFHDAALAAAIEDALADAGYALHAVGEGFAHRPGWRARDAALPDAIAASDLFVSAAGIGAIAQSRAFGVPLVAIATAQPEQRRNLTAATTPTAVVDVGDRMRERLAAALATIPAATTDDPALAVRRSRSLWQRTLVALVDRHRSRNRKEF